MIPTRFCECGASMRAGRHGHAEGCPRNWQMYWLRLQPMRITVADRKRWIAVKLFIAGACFYSGLAINVSDDAMSTGYFVGAGLMTIGLIALARCCRW